MDNLEMLGVGCALVASLSWAMSTIILKSLTARIDTLPLNTFRLWVGSFLLLLFVFLTGRSEPMVQTPLTPLLLVMASGVVAVAGGDTVYIKSLSLIDASKAFTVAQCAFPLLTALVAILFLGEAFTWRIAAGAALVICGICFVSGWGRAEVPGSRAGHHTKGLVCALTAAVAWTFAATTLKIGVVNMDTYVAAGIRIPAAAVVLTLFVLISKSGSALNIFGHGTRSTALAAFAGILTYGVAAVAYVTAIQSIGAARTVLITTTAPILVVPFSMLLLKERPGGLALAGIASCVVGICFIAA